MTERSEATDNVSDVINNYEHHYLRAMELCRRFPTAATAAHSFKNEFADLRERSWKGRVDWIEVVKITRGEDDDNKWRETLRKEAIELAMKKLTPADFALMLKLVLSAPANAVLTDGMHVQKADLTEAEQKQMWGWMLADFLTYETRLVTKPPHRDLNDILAMPIFIFRRNNAIFLLLEDLKRRYAGQPQPESEIVISVDECEGEIGVYQVAGNPVRVHVVMIHEDITELNHSRHAAILPGSAQDMVDALIAQGGCKREYRR